MIIPFILLFVIDRIQEAISSHASGRSDIWFVGWKSLEKYWFFGAGLDNFTKAYTEFIAYTPDLLVWQSIAQYFVGLLVELGWWYIHNACLQWLRTIVRFGLNSSNRQWQVNALCSVLGIIISGLYRIFSGINPSGYLDLIVMHKYVMRPQRRLIYNMCGICGIYEKADASVNSDTIIRMRDVMVSRGPDDAVYTWRHILEWASPAQHNRPFACGTPAAM